MRPENGAPDLRRTQRISVDLAARYTSGDVQLEGRALNLSEEGVFFTLKAPDPIFDQSKQGSGVYVEINLLGRALKAFGEVCWIDGATPGVGIKFVDMAAADQARLAALIGLPPIDA
jgi:hypothetical protein